jgi:hypothetical protein
VSQVDDGESRAGDPRYGVLFGGHLYLCADAERRLRFVEKPLRYARVNLPERGFCPHCWGREPLTRGIAQRLFRSESRLSLSASPSLEAAEHETVKR